jgi:membrane protein implicated in regulation of membrane protease activity
LLLVSASSLRTEACTVAKVNPKALASKAWAAIRGFLRKQWRWLVIALFLALLVLIYAGYWAPWTGFGQRLGTVSAEDRAKTLWDWLDLLFVPLVLAFAAALFTWVTNRREREAEEKRIKERQGIEERRLKEQREIELDRSRQAALQTYLDRITILLRDKWRESGGGFLEANIIRAQTLTVLRQLDGERRGLLLRFLYESGLIVKPKKGWRHRALVDLRRADMRGAFLMTWANLIRADLSGVVLSGADLTWANLSGANLSGAVLSEAVLDRTNLSGADLSGANLSGANLSGANLSGANLTGVNLIGAKVTWIQLAQAKSLEGATLPDGTKYASKGPSESEEAAGAEESCNDRGGAG